MVGSMMGIEIGSKNIKIIEVTKKAATLVVQKFSLIETPKNCINNGVVSNIEPIRKVIAEELKIKKYRAKNVVTVVQSNTLIIRNAIMEKQPEKIIGQLLEMKTEDYLPVERNQYQIDFKIVREVKDEESTKNEILLVAAPNAVILPVASLIKSLKLTPVLITTPSEALNKVFSTYIGLVYEKTPNIMVLDIGGSFTTATILSHEQAVLTRMIEFGVEDINEIVNDNFMKQHDQSTEEYDQLLADIIRPQIEYNIISEVERILQFYYSNYNNGSIKKIYLIGGGANIRGIRTYVRDALNIPTEKLDEFSMLIEKPGIEFEPYRRFFVNLLGAINGL